MININNIRFKDADYNKGYEVEKKEHYQSILNLVHNEELSEKIVRQIAKDHEKESKDYYKYLEIMERQF
jgi:hypothetical protein